MDTHRRHFLGTAFAAGVAAAQEGESPRSKGKDELPTPKAKVVKVFKGPDPYGMCLHDGYLYYCDAGFPVGSNVSNDPDSGWMCRIDL